MVMEEDRGVGHGGEPNCRDPDLPEIPKMILLRIFTEILVPEKLDT